MAKKNKVDELFDEVESEAKDVQTRYEQTVGALRKNKEGKSNNQAGERLQQYIDRITGLLEEREGINEDIRDVYSEVKSAGFHVPVVRQVIKYSRTNTQKRVEDRELFDLYIHALGIEA